MGKLFKMSDKREKHKHADKKKSRKSENKEDEVIVNAIKHFDVFYNQPPPGLVKEDEEKPEDCIPDLPENSKAREFLAHAPTKGLWMPLGKEVKVMKCWRCKTYGHRTGDKECPLFISGNLQCEQFRATREDPMHDFIASKTQLEKQERVKQLQTLLEESTSSDSSSSSSSEDEHRRRKKRKRSSSKKVKKSKKKKSSKKRKH